MHCFNMGQGDMSLAMGLYDLSPKTQTECIDILSKRAHRLSWEVWHIILSAPFQDMREDVHVTILESLKYCTEFPRIASPLMRYLAQVVKHPSPKVRQAYQSLRDELGGTVFTSILSGYMEDV